MYYERAQHPGCGRLGLLRRRAERPGLPPPYPASVTQTAPAPAPPAVGRSTDRERLFTRMWAVAALAHVVGNGWQGDVLPTPDAGGIALAAVSVAAFAALLRPGRLPLLVLSTTIVVGAIVEVPILGNHWLVAALVSLAYLLSGGRWGGFEPAARLVLLVFYSFAAFAKINEGFADPAVSCAVFYADQSLTAAGLAPLTPGGTATAVLPWLVTAIELSVPVLLIVRPTRWVGVLLALGFHSTVSFDLGQHFYDFTAVLAALFVLFLPDAWSRAATDRLRRLPAVLTAGVAGAAVALTALLVLASLVPLGALPWRTDRLAFVVWVPYAVTLIVLVLLGPRRSERLSWRPAALAWLAVALTLLNGLTPWTETKTAFGFTMYSNLEVAQGQTNHTLVPATLPLRDGLDRLVAVESSSDPGLAAYAGSGYLLPWPSFAVYVRDHPGMDVTYRDGVRLDGSAGTPAAITPGEDTAEALGPIPWWWQWMPLRAVDTQSPPRCQVAWLPAL